MIKIVVGSRNPVKINAAKTAICDVFSLQVVECIGVDAPSGVAEQPMSSVETQQGALNRVKYCQQHTKADFYVAIEGGVDEFTYTGTDFGAATSQRAASLSVQASTFSHPATFAYVVIADQKQISVGRSCNLPLPPKVYRALQSGQELGDVMDKLFNTQNVKQKGGAIGLLTNGLATREGVYTQAAILALAPFVNPDLYAE
jgi:inosine/xanthosine triphosphatase